MDRPIILLRDESSLLRQLAERDKARPGVVLRRLILREAVCAGLLDGDAAEAVKQSQRQGEIR